MKYNSGGKFHSERTPCSPCSNTSRQQLGRARENRPVHMQKADYPLSEFEMYIRDNTSGGTRENHSFVLLQNGSYLTDNNLFPDLEMVRHETQQTARGVCLVIFVAIGTVLNIFMIVSIVPNRRLRSVRNILLVHLGCTGLLMSFLINLVSAVVSFTGRWLGGMALCQTYGFLLSVLTLVTSWTIAALSWDKYQTIASPLHHSLTATAVKMIACFAIFWTVACTLSLPPLLGGSRYVFHPEKGICFVCTETIIGKVYIVSYLLAAVYIPLGIMLYCYTHIYRIARTQSSRIAATMIRMTCVIQATIAPSSQTSNTVSLKGTKAMRTIFQLIGAFILVYIPISVILLTDIISDTGYKMNTIVTSTLAMLFHSSPVINSAVYGLRNKILRTSFYRYVRRNVRHYCYKDKRKNSVKSFRSGSLKAAMLNRRHQNGNATANGGLRRTQSFPIRGSRGAFKPVVRESTEKCNGHVTEENEQAHTRLLLPRPRSYNVLNPMYQKCSSLKSDENGSSENGIIELDDIPMEDIPEVDDIPDIDDILAIDADEVS